MAPIIKFKYSKAYDDLTLSAKPLRNTPSREQIFSRIEVLESFWNDHGSAVFSCIADITGHQQIDPNIDCYVVSGKICYASPLTIGYSAGSNETACDILIHEITHLVMIGLGETRPAKLNKLYRRYTDEDPATINHIPVNATIRSVYATLGWERRLTHIIKRESTDQRYARAWDIVEEIGPSKILKSLIV